MERTGLAPLEPPRKEEGMKYKTEDSVLSALQLPDPCRVEIEITPKLVFLKIGPRDWQWDRESGKFVGAGTLLLENKVSRP